VRCAVFPRPAFDQQILVILVWGPHTDFPSATASNLSAFHFISSFASASAGRVSVILITSALL
jgi:hypothetical protein